MAADRVAEAGRPCTDIQNGRRTLLALHMHDHACLRYVDIHT